MDLLEFRNRIDAIDDALVPLLMERMGIARAVAEYKIQNRLPVIDREREQKILERVTAQFGADAAFVETVYAAILNASRALQQSVADADKTTGTDLKK